MSEHDHPEDEAEIEAGVPAELIDLYIDLEPEAIRRGVTVEQLAEELKELA